MAIFTYLLSSAKVKKGQIFYCVTRIANEEKAYYILHNENTTETLNQSQLVQLLIY